MILRKPYAILIKYFKLIHIIMFVLFTYLVFALRKIYVFFANYISTSNFTYTEDMVSRYVPWIVFVVIVILFALAIGILLLMHKKEKPVLFYKIMIGFSVFLIIILIYFAVFFKSLDDTVYEPLRLVVNRDIILFAYIFNYFFVVFSFIRGFGFDIKKFSFDKDKKELNLDESDSEEYELNVNIEKDDIKSFINSHRRELKYYVKENKLIFIIVGAIILVSGSLYFYFDHFVINKIYHEGDNVNIGNLVYHVNSSSITNVDKFGQELSDDSDYLIINMNILNHAGTGHLNEQTLRVHVDDDYYYPATNLCDMFSDLGTCYKMQELKNGTDNKFIVVYKIKKEHQKIYLEILKNISNKYNYSKIELAYKKDYADEVEKTVNDEFEIDNNIFKINKYAFFDKTSYQYEECIENDCKTFVKRILPNTGEIVLSLEIENLDKLSDDFINSAIGLKYNDKTYTGKNLSLIGKKDNTLYYSVPSFLETVDQFTLIITTRKIKYNIMLGGGIDE